jgi:Protein of unknown function (DUF1549)/Protein of unknown function (DUF1553)
MKRWLILTSWLVAAAACAGADAPPVHWAFAPLRKSTPPKVGGETWCRTTLDRYVAAWMERNGQAPSPEADRRTLYRRVCFDLTGLPPAAEDADAFEADRSPDAYDRRIEQLLESPRYGEHWGRHWLDVVRYADTAGETADYPAPAAWRYRNYVIDSFNADKPYDVFLREQIAGDILARRGPPDQYAERVAATGFLAISRRFGFDSENYHHLTIQDTIDTLGQSVLGLTLGCARCHAHKYDPVPMRDYYALYGIFESTRYAFPGSEQKQRTRALVPLLPRTESQRRWREFEGRVAALSAEAERAGVKPPSGVLRSLDDIDGDFELQAPAAGGSKGVLVPPWVCEGPVSVATEAQSPFKNLHPAGRVGVSLPGGTNILRIAQRLHAGEEGRSGPFHINLDFKTSTNDASASGGVRFSMAGRSPAVEVVLGRTALVLHTGAGSETLPLPAPGQWNSLQLRIDPERRTVSGTVGRPGAVSAIAARPTADGWNGRIDSVSFTTEPGAAGPATVVDNFAVLDDPIPAVSENSMETPASPETAEGLTRELKELAGMDGDLELQTDGMPPSAPWNPGPNAAVAIRASAQSPFDNIYPPGSLGVALPAGGAYDGFGLQLPTTWKADATGRLYADFDLRVTSTEPAGGGSWRYYLGHGPGGSAAVELYFTGSQLFRRSGDARDAVCTLASGQWRQVRLTLDLKGRRYTGEILGSAVPVKFEGAMAPGWDGVIDHTFIDSYGHLPGARPALDADNFLVGESEPPAFGSHAAVSRDVAAKRAAAAALRRRSADLVKRGEAARRELERLLADGPFPLAYGVTEGTPREARIQLRGDPDQPGETAPRGFLSALGGGPLPRDTDGSGRLELADWLASPRNPLTARVMVNRIWQHHFGEPLVKTPNDFGARGRPPAQPELLDFLASEFIRSGWSVKAMHRLILRSAVYRQQSLWSSPPSAGQTPQVPACPVIDTNTPFTRLEIASSAVAAADRLSPFPRRRLGAEEIRDSILAVCGDLDTVPGTGHPFPAPTTWGYTQHSPFTAVYDSRKRSVYLMTQRIQRHPFLALFDGADPNASSAARRTTTAPTQALFFLNDPLVHDAARRLADRIAAVSPEEPARIQGLYRRILSRNPTAEEVREAGMHLASCRRALAEATGETERGALASLARVLFSSNEFLTVD